MFSWGHSQSQSIWYQNAYITNRYVWKHFLALVRMWLECGCLVSDAGNSSLYLVFSCFLPHISFIVEGHCHSQFHLQVSWNKFASWHFIFVFLTQHLVSSNGQPLPMICLEQLGWELILVRPKWLILNFRIFLLIWIFFSQKHFMVKSIHCSHRPSWLWFVTEISLHQLLCVGNPFYQCFKIYLLSVTESNLANYHMR